MTARRLPGLSCAALLALSFGCADVVSNGGPGGTGGVGGVGGVGGNGGNGGAGGCATNFDCGGLEYCFSESCGGLGTCEVRPVDCTAEVAFVCGCDMKTYDNACEAMKAGVRIAADGECVCADNSECDELDYCDGEACAGSGTCEARPASCAVIFDPVCGCDGNTYDNECLAEMAGVRIESMGVCPCASNDECLGTEYCAAEVCVGPGTCEVRPTICPLIFDPVCGCDDVTYGNSCAAALSGMRIAFDAACP